MNTTHVTVSTFHADRPNGQVQAVNDRSASQLSFEDSPCLQCGGRDLESVIQATDPLGIASEVEFQVVRCRCCDLCFTNPRPTPECIGQFYPANYGPHHKPSTKPQGGRWPWSPSSERKSFAPFGGRRLLDFGCGSGSYLVRMREQGWHVTGMDVSASTAERVRETHHIAVYVGTLPHPDLESQSFDAVTMWQALEHVHYPLETLREAQRLLTPGGKLVVAVPNFDSLPRRWFRIDWHCLELPRHLTHFTPRTLPRMIEQAGLTVETVRLQRQPGWFRKSVALVNGKSARNRRFRWLNNRLASSFVCSYAHLTGQSDGLVVTARK